METKELRELMGIFEKSELSVMEIEKSGDTTRIRMEKGRAGAEEAPVPFKTEEKRTQGGCVAEKTEEASPEKEESPFTEVKAPIVGIFYEAPSPGAEPFVREGQPVEEGQVLCLIEAMKMMNELKAPCKGIVRRVVASNGGLVEYNQTIFEVEPC